MYLSIATDCKKYQQVNVSFSNVCAISRKYWSCHVLLYTSLVFAYKQIYLRHEYTCLYNEQKSKCLMCDKIKVGHNTNRFIHE